MPNRMTTFGFRPGRKVGARYVIEGRLGGGTEGEVYQIREIHTGIRRAAKFHFPHRDPKHRLLIRHAQKLNALRQCPIVLQYHHSDIITVRRETTLALISELCEGEPLQRWVDRHRGKRLPIYTAMHVLYNLVRGLESIHALGQYHSDVHTENILIKPQGVRFELKMIDFYDWGAPARYKQKQDITDTTRVFYNSLGGREHYAKLPAEAKTICCGLNDTLILKRFPTMRMLRGHLESFDWSTLV